MKVKDGRSSGAGFVLGSSRDILVQGSLSLNDQPLSNQHGYNSDMLLWELIDKLESKERGLPSRGHK